MLRTQLKTLQDPITVGSNFQFLVRLLVAIKGISADDPTIFRFMRELIARMLTLQFRQELESSSLEEQIQTLYALVSYESRLFLAWLRYVLKPSSIIAAMIWDWTAVACITAKGFRAALGESVSLTTLQSMIYLRHANACGCVTSITPLI